MNISSPRPLFPILFGLLPALSALASPRIQLESSVLELGKVKQNEVVEKDLLVRNLGDEVLELQELSTSCPCTFPEIIDPKIDPGGTGRIHVTFQSKTYQGDVHKMIEVYSNDPDQSYLELGLHVFVDAAVLVDPDTRQLDFGDVESGASPELSADFHAADGIRLDLALLEYDEGIFDCEVVGAVDGDPSSARLTVGLKSGAPAGPLREIIRVGTDTPGAEEIDLEIFGRVKAELQADPERLNFRMVSPGSELDRTLTLRSAGAPFSVTSADIDLPGLEVEVLDGGPGRAARLRVHGSALSLDDEAASKTRGRMKGTLRIHTDHPRQPELEVVVLYMLRA